jgi:hypothetical protein
MKPLLEVTHSTYLRRLVREVNAATEHGIYMECPGRNIRLKRVMYVNGGLMAKSASGSVAFKCSPDKLIDGYGRSIVASRKS